jgi:hypothetical protein
MVFFTNDERACGPFPSSALLSADDDSDLLCNDGAHYGYHGVYSLASLAISSALDVHLSFLNFTANFTALPLGTNKPRPICHRIIADDLGTCMYH